jgi:hypothetical protein
MTFTDMKDVLDIFTKMIMTKLLSLENHSETVTFQFKKKCS